MKKTFLLLVGIVCSCLVWGQTITINTIDDLAGLATDIVAQNGYAGQTIEINADLTVSKIWTPIGTAAQPFQGTVKGNGHIISGLGAVKGTDGIGVFGYVGAQATIEELGIGTGHIKTMKNDVCQYVGALAGHNAGKINRCWNMTTLEVNGRNVGGLVGWNEGEITDCYNAGPITKATDYIGGLVGTNKGTISYCYNIGFVRNGYGLVAINDGTINKGCYDRKLYIQNPDEDHQDVPGVTAIEKTKEMFSLFSTRETWTNSADNYPILTKFKDHDAAQVSVASIDLTDNGNSLPDNHLNLLTDFFRVNTANGVSWQTPSPASELWVYPSPADPTLWLVGHPCRPTEEIITVSKNGHVREVYTFPMPVADFYAGKLAADSIMVCLNEPLYYKDIDFTLDVDPWGGCLPYHLIMDAIRLNKSGDTLSHDTVFNVHSWGAYVEIMKEGSWTPTKSGYYHLKRSVADAQCHPYLEESEGFIFVYVPDDLTAGEIEARDNDSLCFADSVITIQSTIDGACEGTTILYYWTMNEDSIKGQEGASLTDFALPKPGKYTFKRYVYNDACVDREDAKKSDNEYTVTLLEEFKEGKISSEKSWKICDPAAVVSTVGTIEASAATGGDEHITYQWYMGDAAIEGATEQNLVLGSATLPATFTYGQTYIFYRTAKDGQCQTDPVSTDTVTVEVYPVFTEGAIQSADDDSICWTDNHTITIGSLADATFGDLPVYYYWTVNGVEIPDSDSKTLTYELPAVGEYTFRRFAYNEKCISKTDAVAATSEYKVTLLAAFNPGSIPSATITACSVADALEQLSKITGTEAGGGSGKYTYSWEMYENGVLLQLEDEDGKDLDLTQHVTMNAKYEFTRKAFDTKCDTEGQLSEGKVVIEIYGDITPGRIESKTIDKTCLVPGQVKEIPIEIASEQPATTERGNIVYSWYMVVNGETYAVAYDTESLSYTLSIEGISRETEFTFYRTAYNSDCQSAEVNANGETKVVVSFTNTIEKEVVLCESQFVDGKYTYIYPSLENPHKQVVFDLNNLQPESFTDYLEPSACPPLVTLTPVVIPSPVIKTEDSTEVCQEGENGTLTLYFQMVKGSADMYSIELGEGLRPYFDNKTYISGTMPLVKEGEPGVITLQCKRIGYLGGEKIMYLQVGISSEEEGQSSCFSTLSKIKLTVTQGGYIESKYDKVLFIDNNPKKETDPKFTGYQWYKNGILVEGATGQYYHEGGATLVGSYFADLTYIENGKETIMRTCTLQMPVESGRKVGVPTSNVTKQLEDGQIIIQRGEGKYDIFGNKMSNL